MNKPRRWIVHMIAALSVALPALFGGQKAALASYLPNDPLLANQYYLKQIKANRAWDIVVGNPRIKIAVLDSGVDLNHPDLKANLVPGINLVDPGKPPMDDNGHGTQVAGILAAKGNNRLGVSGVMWTAHIMPIKVLDSSGNADNVDILATGIREAVNNGAKVVLMSVSVLYPSPELESAVRYAESRGVVLVAAAGNEGSRVTYPAAYPTVIAVGAVNSNNVPLWQSNNGPELKLMAPGLDIYTTMPGGKYGTISGTSAAAPQVAAAAALILAKNPDMTPLEVRQLLYATAMDLGPRGWDRQTGYGLLDVSRAVRTRLTADTFEPNNSKATAVPFPIESQVRAALSAGDRTDWYYMDIPYEGTVTFSAWTSSKSVAAISATFYEDGRQPVHIYLGSGDEESVPVKPGRMYIRLERGGNVGSFQYILTSRFAISPDEQEPNNTRYTARPLPPGNRVSIDGTFHTYGDIDWFSYYVRSPGKLRLTVTTDTLRIDPVLYVEKEGSRGIPVDNGTARDPTEQISLDVTPGKYLIGVKDYWNNVVNGMYELSLDFTPERKDTNEPNDTYLYATRVGDSGLMTGTIASKSDVDWFVFTLPSDSSVTVMAPSVPVSSGVQLDVYRSDQLDQPLDTETQVAELSIRGRPVLNMKLPEGTYYLRVTSTTPFRYEAYRLTMSVRPSASGQTDAGAGQRGPVIVGPPAPQPISAFGPKGVDVIRFSERLIRAIQRQDASVLFAARPDTAGWAFHEVLTAYRQGLVERAAGGFLGPFLWDGQVQAVIARVNDWLALPFDARRGTSGGGSVPAADQTAEGRVPVWRDGRFRSLWIDVPTWLRKTLEQ